MIAIDTIRLTAATIEASSPPPAPARRAAARARAPERTATASARARAPSPQARASAAAHPPAGMRSPGSRPAAGRRSVAGPPAGCEREERQTRRRRAQPGESRLLVAGLERPGRRSTRGLRARHDAAQQRRGDAQHEERRERHGSTRIDGSTPRKNRRRGRSGDPHRRARDRVACDDTERRAADADQRAFERTSRASRPRVTPSTRSSANCARRRTTPSACVENTSSPPVNSATSASTLRFTR